MTEREQVIMILERAISFAAHDDWGFVEMSVEDARRVLNVAKAQGPQIIECAGCKYWDSESGLSARKCAKWNAYTKQHDWCSYAERRQG